MDEINVQNVEFEEIKAEPVRTEADVKKGHDYALYSLLSALIGFFVGFGLVGGILGLYFAKVSADCGEESELLTAGKISSIVVTALSAFFAVLVVIWLVFIFAAIGSAAVVG